MKKTPSHVGIGLAAGAIIGLAAGLFLQSKQGKKISKDAMKRAQVLQKQLLRKLDDVEGLTKEKYGELVDEVLAYYQKGKEVAKDEIPAVRTYLLGRWKQMQAYLDAKMEDTEE